MIYNRQMKLIISSQAPNATKQISAPVRSVGCGQNPTLWTSPPLFSHTTLNWLVSRTYQLAQMPADLTRNLYHPPDDTGMLEKVLREKFFHWAHLNEKYLPKEMLTFQHVRLHFDRRKGKSENHIE